jgi:hypothetical protein
MSVYLYGFENTTMGAGHWNPLGHRVAAEETAIALERLVN